MAVSNKFFQMSLHGGGSSSNKNVGKTSGLIGNNSYNSAGNSTPTRIPTGSIDTSYGGNLNLVSGSTKKPQISVANGVGSTLNNGIIAAGNDMKINTLYKDNLVNLKPVNGGIGGSAGGGVTSEGVILGNPNVTPMPQINQWSEAKQPTKAPITYGQQLAVTAAAPQNGSVIVDKNKDIASSAPQKVNAAETKGSTGASGSTTGTTGSTAGGGKVDSYEEFLLKQEGFYKEQLDKLNAQIEQNKQSAIERAEQERQRGVIDARSSYAQNLATYGANAEQLASMGLSGSGYSDYLNQQAYATQRAETQGANAQAEAEKVAAEQQANSDKLNAELSYAQNMQGNSEKLAQYQQQKQEKAEAEAEQKKQYYAALLTSANTGEYTSEQIAELGKQYGLSEEQITSITNAASTYKTNTQKSNYSELMVEIENRGTNKTILDTALKNGDISQEQYDDLLVRYQTNTYDDYSSVIGTDFSQADTHVIDNAYNRGEITKAQYEDLKTQYNKGVASAITAASLFYSNGAALDSSTAKAIIDKLVSTGWLTQDTKNKINNAYDQAYNSNDDGGGCYAKGTMITVADGSQKAVEDVKVGDPVLVFNHLTGELDVAPVSYVFHDGEKEYEILKLRFDDAADVEVLFEHGFFDVDSKEYVLINPENAKDFVGHRFYRVTAKNGAYDKGIVALTDYEVYSSQTECYAVVTAWHINSFANGMLSVTDDIKGLYNIFELDSDMKYDAQKMEEDIQKYGLFSYDDWKGFVSEEEFTAFNGAFLKVAIGKCLVTQNEIMGYIKKFLQQQ